MAVVDIDNVAFTNNRGATNNSIGKTKFFGGVFDEKVQRDDESFSDNSSSSCCSDDSGGDVVNKKPLGGLSRRLGSFADSLHPSSSQGRSFPMLIPSESDSSSCSSSSDSDVSPKSRHRRGRHRSGGFGKIKKMQKKAVKLISSVPLSPNKQSKNKNTHSFSELKGERKSRSKSHSYSTDEMTSLINNEEEISLHANSSKKNRRSQNEEKGQPDLTQCHTDETDEDSSSSGDDSCCSTSDSSSDGDYITGENIRHTHWINKQGYSMSLLPVVREEEEDIIDEVHELVVRRNQYSITKDSDRITSSRNSYLSPGASENTNKKAVKTSPLPGRLPSPATTSLYVQNSKSMKKQAASTNREHGKRSRQSSSKAPKHNISSNNSDFYEELDSRLNVILSLKDVIVKQKKQIKASDKQLTECTKKAKATKRIICYLRKIHLHDRHKINHLQKENDQLKRDLAFYREQCEKSESEQQNSNIISEKNRARVVQTPKSKKQQKKETKSPTIELIETLNKLRKLEISMSGKSKQCQQSPIPSPTENSPAVKNAPSLDISFLKYIDENTKSITLNEHGDVLEVSSEDETVVSVGSRSVVNNESHDCSNKSTSNGPRRLNGRFEI